MTDPGNATSKRAAIIRRLRRDGWPPVSAEIIADDLLRQERLEMAARQ